MISLPNSFSLNSGRLGLPRDASGARDIGAGAARARLDF